MSDAYAVIARCQRNGAIQWGQVAKQLGISVDKARRLYDATSSARVDPQQLAEPDPATLPDAEVYKSPHPKGESLKHVILTLLERFGHLTSEDLANRTQSPANSIRTRLCTLRAQMLVCSDSGLPRTWSLTQAGRTIAKTYRERPGQVGPGAVTDLGRAA